jgi:hypothetical protein
MEQLFDPALLDRQKAEAARDAAIAQVYAASDERWRKHCLEVIAQLAQHKREFTTDDVWEMLDLRPREPRALGAMMREAASRRIVSATDRYRNSERPACHARPVRVWRSEVL